MTRSDAEGDPPGEAVTEQPAFLVVLVNRDRPVQRAPTGAIRQALVDAGARGLREFEPAAGWEVEAAPLVLIRIAEAAGKKLGWTPQVGMGIASSHEQARQLAEQSVDRTIVVARPIYERVREAVVAHADPSGEAVIVTALVDAARPSFDWQTWVQTGAAIVGAAAGLAVWVVLVGGATMWVRLNRADVPETQAVAALPRSVLGAVGLQVLAVILLFTIPLTLLVVALGALGRRRVTDAVSGAAKFMPQVSVKQAAAVGTIALVLALYTFYRFFHVRPWWGVWIFLSAAVGGVLVYVVFGLLSNRQIARALAVSAIVFLTAGWIAGLREVGSVGVRIDRAAVMVDGDSHAWEGLFIARTSDTLVVARPGPDGERFGCRIHLIANENVRFLRVREYRDRDTGFSCNDPSGDASMPPRPTPPPAPAPPTGTPPPTQPTAVTVTVPVTVTVVGEGRPTNGDNGAPGDEGQTNEPSGEKLPRKGSLIDIDAVKPPLRLAISPPEYLPRPLQDTSPLKATFVITAVPGDYLVQGARVYARSLATYLTSDEALSNEKGEAVLCLTPRSGLPFRRGARIPLFIRAWDPAGPPVSATSQRRLVRLYLGKRVNDSSDRTC